MRNREQNQKVFQVVLAVLIAIMLWLYVVNVENPTGSARLHDLPIQIQGEEVLEENGLMVTGVSQDTMSVRLTGRKKTLMKVSRKNVTLTVDVSSVTASGDWTLGCKISYPANVSADSVSVSHWDDMKVTVTVEPKTTKVIPVRAQFIGTEAEGYQVGAISVEPSQITLDGPEATLGEISYGLAQVEETELSQSLVVRTPVILMTEENVPAADVAHVTCEPSALEVTVPVSRVEEIPLAVELIPGGGATEKDVAVQISPEAVTVVAGRDGQEQPDRILLGRLPLSEVFERASYSLPIVLPEGMTGWNLPEYATVTLTVDQLNSRQVAVDTGAIQWSGVPEGYTPRLVSSRLYVWVRGDADLVETITADDISVSVDLSQAETGDALQRFPAKVSLNGTLGESAGIIGTQYSIALRLLPDGETEPDS